MKHRVRGKYINNNVSDWWVVCACISVFFVTWYQISNWMADANHLIRSLDVNTSSVVFKTTVIERQSHFKCQFYLINLVHLHFMSHFQSFSISSKQSPRCATWWNRSMHLRGIFHSIGAVHVGGMKNAHWGYIIIYIIEGNKTYLEHVISFNRLLYFNWLILLI